MLKILERSIALQLLVFYALFIVPVLLGGVELYLFQRNALQQSAQQADLGIAQAISLNVEATVRSASEEDIDLAQNQAAIQLDLPQLFSVFATAARFHSDISLYFVCDASGHLLLSYPAHVASNGKQYSSCQYMPSANAQSGSNSPFLSPERVSPTTQMAVVSLTVPILNASGQPIGILGINVPLSQFTLQLMTVQKQLTPNGEVHIWIVDEDGQLLSSTERVSLQTNLLATLPGLAPALEGRQGNLIAHEQNRDWLYSYSPVAGTRWAVVVQRPTDVTFAAIISFQNTLLIALLALVVGASFFWFVLHGWMVAPLAKLAKAARMIHPSQTEKVTDSELLARDRGRLDEVGQLISAFSTMEDEIHALFRKSDETSQARLHTLDAIMRSMDEGVLLEDPDGQIIYANYSFTQFVGLSEHEIPSDSFDATLVEEKLLALIEAPDTYREAIRLAETAQGPHLAEFQVHGYYNRVGQLMPARRDIRMRLFQVRDQAGQLIGRGKIFRDVTQQNEAEQVKKNLLAIVSHELRTPLTAIKGYATSLLATDVELDDALQMYFLRRIVEESDRLAELVTSLLAMSQLEAGTLKLAPSLCRLETLLEQAAEGHAPDRIRVQIADNIPLLYVDRQRIEVVLRNLLENARHYAGANAEIEIAARYEQDPASHGLYLSITDNGPGLPAQLTERIFDRFYQIDGGRERNSSGVGLGLAICRGFIEAHGGRIWAQNRCDGVTGAIFHIWLPPKVLHLPGSQPKRFELHNAL
jgi:PAS domain S-box-containing protein